MADNVSGGLPNLGRTYHGGTPSSIGRSVELEGTEVNFRDDYKSGAEPKRLRSGRVRVCRLVRNTSGISLAPKRAVKWESGFRGLRVNGYCSITSEECAGVVDDQLSASGVADDDLFWVMRKGPGLCKTALASAAIAENDIVVALTSASSVSTTAGRLGVGGNTVALNVINRIGRAISARTAAETDADILIDLELM